MQFITREQFIAAVRSEPKDDDLERCNCPYAGEFGHTQCGWNVAQNLPQFMCLGGPWTDGHAAVFNLPKDNCVPATAKAIMDLDRKPLTERQQQIGENIARAVEAMTHNSLIGSYRRNVDGN